MDASRIVTYWQGIVLNVVIFQLGWAVCILGGNTLAVIYTFFAVILHAAIVLKNLREALVIVVFTIVGSCWDTLLMHVGVISFSTDSLFIPPWLVCLWLLFACTLNHSLAWLKNKLLLSALLGAVVAPLSYLAGIKLGAAYFVMPVFASLAIIAIAWTFFIPIGLCAIRRYCDD
tara:strand:- start:104 stop:625 length:522 start_codon:yes stop_codon:yes gene_type:complete